MKQTMRTLIILCVSLMFAEAQQSDLASQIIHNSSNQPNNRLHEYKDFFFLEQQWSPTSIIDSLYTVGPGDVFQYKGIGGIPPVGESITVVHRIARGRVLRQRRSA